MKNTRSWLIILFLIGIGILFMGTFPGEAAEKTVRIGALWPLSGPASREGQEAKAAVELAKDNH